MPATRDLRGKLEATISEITKIENTEQSDPDKLKISTFGFDGSQRRALKTDTNGFLQTQAGATIVADNAGLVKDTTLTSGTVNAIDSINQIKSGSIEVTGGTVNTQIDNLNYAGTVNVVNSISNPVTSDVGSGTRPTSLQTDNIGLFKTTDFTETRTLQTDNIGLFKTSDFTESREATISADNVGLLRGSGTVAQANIHGVDQGGTVHQLFTTPGGTLGVSMQHVPIQIPTDKQSTYKTAQGTISVDVAGTLTTGTVTVDTMDRVGVHLDPSGTIDAHAQASSGGTMWSDIDTKDPFATGLNSRKYYELGELSTQKVRLKLVNKDGAGTVSVIHNVEASAG